MPRRRVPSGSQPDPLGPDPTPTSTATPGTHPPVDDSVEDEYEDVQPSDSEEERSSDELEERPPVYNSMEKRLFEFQLRQNTFDGAHRTGTKAYDWLRTVEALNDTYPGLASALTIATTSLTGDAQHWYLNAFTKGRPTWAIFKKEFRLRFIGAKEPTMKEHLEALGALTMRSDWLTDLNSYIDKFLDLRAKCPSLSDLQLITSFKGGLTDHWLRSVTNYEAISTPNPPCLLDLLQWLQSTGTVNCKEDDRLRLKRRSTSNIISNPKRMKPQYGNRTSGSGASTARKDRSSTATSSPNSTPLRPEWLKKEVLREKACFHCLTPGHTTRDCRSKKQGKPAAKEDRWRTRTFKGDSNRGGHTE